MKEIVLFVLPSPVLSRSSSSFEATPGVPCLIVILSARIRQEVEKKKYDRIRRKRLEKSSKKILLIGPDISEKSKLQKYIHLFGSVNLVPSQGSEEVEHRAAILRKSQLTKDRVQKNKG
jgi:hypothetical protein